METNKPHSRVVGERWTKAALDCVTLGTGLGGRRLRHGLQPITAKEWTQWVPVWDGVAG